MKRRWIFMITALLLTAIALTGCGKEMATADEINAMRNAYYAQFAELKEVKAILDEKGYADDPAHDAAYNRATSTLNSYYIKLPQNVSKVTKEELNAHYATLDEIIETIRGMKEEANAVSPADQKEE